MSVLLHHRRCHQHHCHHLNISQDFSVLDAALYIVAALVLLVSFTALVCYARRAAGTKSFRLYLLSRGIVLLFVGLELAILMAQDSLTYELHHYFISFLASLATPAQGSFVWPSLVTIAGTSLS